MVLSGILIHWCPIVLLAAGTKPSVNFAEDHLVQALYVFHDESNRLLVSRELHLQTTRKPPKHNPNKPYLTNSSAPPEAKPTPQTIDKDSWMSNRSPASQSAALRSLSQFLKPNIHYAPLKYRFALLDQLPSLNLINIRKPQATRSLYQDLSLHHHLDSPLIDLTILYQTISPRFFTSNLQVNHRCLLVNYTLPNSQIPI
jgi:hypothetical protein